MPKFRFRALLYAFCSVAFAQCEDEAFLLAESLRCNAILADLPCFCALTIVLHCKGLSHTSKGLCYCN